MSYNPTDWKDRAIEKPRTYTLQENADGTVTLVPVTGEVYEEGTPVIAAHMNKIEQGIAGATDAIDTHEGRTDNPHEVTPAQVGAVDRSGDTMTGALTVQSSNITVDGTGNVHYWLRVNGENKGLMFYDVNNERLVLRSYTATGGFHDVFLFSDGKFRLGSNDIWHDGRMRWNSAGYMEYNDGGTWRPVAGVKSVQRGVTDLNDGDSNINVSISSVNMSKSFVTMNFAQSRTGSPGTNNQWTSAKLTNSTTLNISARESSSVMSVPWEVIEYY